MKKVIKALGFFVAFTTFICLCVYFVSYKQNENKMEV